MIKLQISNVVAPGLPDDGWAIDLDASHGDEPLDADKVGFELQFDVGPVDCDWTEHFFLYVAAPGRVGRKGRGGKFIVLHEYSFSTLKRYLHSAISACEKEDWEHSLAEL